MFLKSDTTRQRFSQRLAQPRFGPLWFSPRAPRLGAEKKAPTTFDRPPPRRGWGADYSEPRHLDFYGQFGATPAPGVTGRAFPASPWTQGLWTQPRMINLSAWQGFRQLL